MPLHRGIVRRPQSDGTRRNGLKPCQCTNSDVVLLGGHDVVHTSQKNETGSVIKTRVSNVNGSTWHIQLLSIDARKVALPSFDGPRPRLAYSVSPYEELQLGALERRWIYYAGSLTERSVNIIRCGLATRPTCRSRPHRPRREGDNGTRTTARRHRRPR